MTILDNIKNVYFVGIGGIGMSALARYFKLKGYNVAGYDRTQTPLTEKMAREEEIAVNYADDENEIAEIYRNAENTLVVYTPAIPRDNRQLNFFTDRGMKPHKRSEVLGLLSHAGKALCIAGTHGKTTTSTLLAWLLHNSHVKCSAFLGGISENFGSNLLVDTSSDYIVIEADEFDRSFLTLNPEKAVITSMDADHMDIYGNRDSIIAAFEDFACRVVPEGGLFIKKGLEIRKRRVDGFYSLNDKADFYADNLRLENGLYSFDYHGRNGDILNLKLGVPGMVNVENATAAITVALDCGVTADEIRAALPGFKGVHRRFNIISASEDLILIDDYAHHPKEIEATLKSVRRIWPDRYLTVVFQPHLYSRTKDFAPEFAQSLSLADEVVLMNIYPAREKPIPNVSSNIIMDKITVPVRLMTESEIVEAAPGFKGIAITMGAGNIDKLPSKIYAKLNAVKSAA